jgi:hypothetical protein
MRTLLLTLTLVAAPALASPADAGKPAPETPSKLGPGPAPSKQGRDLSRALVPQKTWEGLLDRSAEGLTSAVARSLTAKGEKVPSDLQHTIRQELGKSMSYQDAVDAQAQALQKRFTPAELEQAAKFYESPLGKKMLDELPAAQGEVGDQLQERLASVVPDIIHRVAPSAMEGAGQGAGASPPSARPSAPAGTGGAGGADAPPPATGQKGSSGTSGKGL